VKVYALKMSVDIYPKHLNGGVFGAIGVWATLMQSDGSGTANITCGNEASVTLASATFH